MPNDSDRAIVLNERLNPRVNARVNEAFDRQYGLAPVGEPKAIAFEPIGVENAIVVPASVLAPLVMSDLPALDESRD